MDGSPLRAPALRPSLSRRFLSRKSLAARFLAIAAIAVALIVPGRLMEAQTAREQAEAAGKMALARIATGGVSRLSEIIDESRTILSIMALLPTFSAQGIPDCHRVVTPIVAETAWIDSLSAVSADGKIICSSSSEIENLLVNSKIQFETTLAQKQFQLGGPIVSRITGRPILVATMPLPSPRGGSAALLMAINASWFTALTDDLARSLPGGVVMTIDAEGRLIAQSKSDMEQDTPASALSEIVGLAREGTHTIALADGRTMVFAVRDIPYSRSLLAVGIPQAELDRPVRAIEAGLFRDLSVTISIIIFVFWLGLESFVRPAVTLAAAARRLGRGKFDVAIDSRRWAGEFQALATAITAAAANLADRSRAEAEARASLRAQSLEDPLTRLKNRRGLDLYVDFEWRFCCSRNMDFAAIAFDIDYFKQFNDGYGHGAGDQALQAIAAIMRDQAQEAGGMAARTGGEEFTIVAPGRSALEARTIANAVSLRVTALRMPHAGSPLGWVTLSAGIASTPASDAMSASDVFRAADAALYGAKGSGRNTITTGVVTPGANAGGTGAGVAEPQRESSPDTADRTLQAFPSAMSQ